MPARFAIISAVHDVAPYLPDFIASIEDQDYPRELLHVVAVDDGSTDGSAAVLDEWAARRPGLVTVLRKPNGGQASARNLGLDHVLGAGLADGLGNSPGDGLDAGPGRDPGPGRPDWITFTDPDDLLAPDWFRRVDGFAAEHPTVQLVATRREVFHDRTGERVPHQLDHQFTKRDRLRDLAVDSSFFHGHAPCAAFRTAELRRQQLRFDERIRPNFEDGHFCCAYLLDAPQPTVGYVGTAVYRYRRRADLSSTLDTSWTNPGRYTDVVEHGYLGLLRAAVDRLGSVPVWLQSMVLYELQWYFRTEDHVPSIENAAHGPVADRFVELLAQVAALLDPEVVRAFDSWRLRPQYRDILLHAFTPDPWHAPYAVIDKLDLRQRLMRVTYRYTGERPDERFVVDGADVDPVHAKIRQLRYFDRWMLSERIAWIPYGTLRVVLAGRSVDVRTTEPDQARHVLGAQTVRRRYDLAAARRTAEEQELSPAERRVVALARSRPVRRLFRNAWVLVDRLQNADDSAEHLFAWLRRHRRTVNAWFVVQPGTADYARLRRNPRLVAHGSLRWKLLMLNAEHLISSHADVPVVQPPEIVRLAGGQTWRITFLQHGVTKDDLSRWLDAKDFDLFVTSSPAEYASVAGDGTAYRYTTRETVLTGLPRFDRMLAAGKKYPPADRDLLLIAPTWRHWLAGTDPATGERTVDAERFRASDFAAQWLAVLQSPAVRDAARACDLRVAVLLHPDLQGVRDALDVPDGVELLPFDGTEVRDLFARARVLVTDYSSMSFNAAYIERPVVYFQFDRERVLHGGHLGRQGYFDYERDGFGPVATSAAAAAEAIVRAIEDGPEPGAQYRERIAAAFPQRDGTCCQRVYEAVRDSTRRAAQ